MNAISVTAQAHSAGPFLFQVQLKLAPMRHKVTKSNYPRARSLNFVGIQLMERDPDLNGDQSNRRRLSHSVATEGPQCSAASLLLLLSFLRWWS